jgi:hypothetical protein
MAYPTILLLADSKLVTNEKISNYKLEEFVAGLYSRVCHDKMFMLERGIGVSLKPCVNEIIIRI